MVFYTGLILCLVLPGDDPEGSKRVWQEAICNNKNICKFIANLFGQFQTTVPSPSGTEGTN